MMWSMVTLIVDANLPCLLLLDEWLFSLLIVSMVARDIPTNLNIFINHSNVVRGIHDWPGCAFDDSFWLYDQSFDIRFLFWLDDFYLKYQGSDLYVLI